MADIKQDGDGRESVPLRMIKGNIGVLLENQIPVRAVSLRQDPHTHNGVILVFHGADKGVCDEVGFQLREYGQ